MKYTRGSQHYVQTKYDRLHQIGSGGIDILFHFYTVLPCFCMKGSLNLHRLSELSTHAAGPPLHPVLVSAMSLMCDMFHSLNTGIVMID